MKLRLSFTLSFLLLTFITKLPIAFSNDEEQVVDVLGNPIFPGIEYYIFPSSPPSGGLRLGKTGDSKCPVTILQDYIEVVNGLPVKFSIPEISTGIILTGTPLEIEFTKKPNCAESSKWLVFVDNDIGKACVGIGGPENYPGKKTVIGTFNIRKYKFGYKIVFCVKDSPTCLDIGRYYHDEEGRRLNLTHSEPFEVVFVDVATYDAGIISSV